MNGGASGIFIITDVLATTIKAGTENGHFDRIRAFGGATSTAANGSTRMQPTIEIITNAASIAKDIANVISRLSDKNINAYETVAVVGLLSQVEDDRALRFIKITNKEDVFCYPYRFGRRLPFRP